MEVLHTPNGKFVNLIFIKHVYALAFNQYILTEMDNESINFAIDAANSVLFQIATDNNCNKVVRYGHKNVKFYEGRKLILLVQIIPSSRKFLCLHIFCRHISLYKSL